MNEIQLYFKNNGIELLPDNAQYKNRFTIPSETSNRLYTISQRKSNDEWCCSCRGWIRHRKCKHLTSISGLLQYVPKPKQIKAA